MATRLKTGLLVMLVALAAGVTGLRASTPPASPPASPPDEGMWIPLLISQNIQEMKRLGLELDAEDIYSVNKSSLKDAVVSLGGFCTAEFVSEKGLLFTNHHCAYGGIQALSSTENDYLTDGFVAETEQQELNIPGLEVRILQRIENVTDEMVEAFDGSEDATARATTEREMSATFQERFNPDGDLRIELKSFFYGSEYYVMIYKVYRDVRLVMNPPESIGKYGSDTDNWEWPRHTGDFSVLRVYAGQDNEPADYAPGNKPYKPAHHLPVSLKGVELNDYTMIMGFPGNTDRYLTSFDIQQRQNIQAPAYVDLRTARLNIMKRYMDQDAGVRIAYASKYARVANYWKYFIGLRRGLIRLNTVEKTRAKEAQFMEWVDGSATRQEKYGDMFQRLEEAYADYEPYVRPFYYFIEGPYSVEAIRFAAPFQQLAGMLEGYNAKKATDEERAQMEAVVAGLQESAAEFYKDYRQMIDREVFATMMKMYHDSIDVQFHPELLTEAYKKYGEDDEWMEWADRVFDKSMFSNAEDLMDFLADPKLKDLENDPMYEVLQAFMGQFREQVLPARNEFTDVMERESRTYVQGLREMNPDKKFYSDANSTMRVTYGPVQDYEPADAVDYHYYTTGEGILEKYNPEVPEFSLPDRLLTLLKRKDYGRYARADGQLPVCFIHSCDITGGNSGSPVMNARGELIGIAFDGNWEAMTGDLVYDAPINRTISVDIRYVLFVIDKFAGASHLISELDIKQ